MTALRPNTMNSYGNWTGQQLGNHNAYAAVSQAEFGDGQIRPNPLYTAANIGIPPQPHTSQPYFHGAYQDGLGAPTPAHQAQRSVNANDDYASSYTLSGGYQEGLGSPVRAQPQRNLSPTAYASSYTSSGGDQETRQSQRPSSIAYASTSSGAYQQNQPQLQVRSLNPTTNPYDPNFVELSPIPSKSRPEIIEEESHHDAPENPPPSYQAIPGAEPPIVPGQKS